jgi:hypothetical protein
MWLKYQTFDNRKREANTGDGGNGDGNGGDGGDNSGGENNTGGNTDPFANMWSDGDAGGEAGNANSQQQQQQQQQTAAPTPQEVFDQHFDSLNIGAGFDMAQVTSDIQNGGVEQLNNFANVLAKDIYRAAITQSSKIMDSKVEAAVNAAVNKSSGEFNATLATNELNAALPFTSDESIKPIADAVFSRFVKKGLSVPEAIGKTKAYFEHTFKLAGKTLDTKPPGQQPGQRGFGASGGNPQGTDDEEEQDWVAILGGG